jgi:transposase
MGPLSAKSYPGTQRIGPEPAQGQPLGRATQEIDYGRRGKGYFFGAFCPSTGEALTHAYGGRTIANWVDFLERVNAWLPSEEAGVSRVYAIPRWEFVFTPKYAAYLNLIEPWWKALRSLALKGRRFESWDEVVSAVERATDYWNQHRHPFRWGHRRRHRSRRKPGCARLPIAA